MKLGFVSAILPDLSLDEVFAFASRTGFDCVELMCWPEEEGASRKYAGVTHINVDALDERLSGKIAAMTQDYGVGISALGYYPNPLSPDREERETAILHLNKVINAAEMLNIGLVNTFAGRDPLKTIEDNWDDFIQTWTPILHHASSKNVRVAIENCPMLFTKDEWPGGKNLMISPKVWERAFKELPDANFGLNFDPSHFVWQEMNYLKAVRHFAGKFFHVHAKDARLDQDRLDKCGLLGYPNDYHTPKIPGHGDIDWWEFMKELHLAGYTGAVCVEVEDREYESTLNDRQAALVLSLGFLRSVLSDVLTNESQ